MEYGNQKVVSSTGVGADIDVGLRQHMLRVYNYMTMALGITGAVAYGVASSPALMTAIFGSSLRWLVILAPLGLVFFLSARIQKMSVGAAQTSFWIFAVLMGMSMASVFVIYTGTSIARVFFITAASFGALSLYGYTTKRDLSAIGKFFFMGLIGIIIAMVVNFFLKSPAIYFAISVIGVLVFAGLTAYDTQKIKEMYLATDASDIAGKKAIMGALTLYLDFINMFMFLLQLFGARR